ncbi:MAG: hypothetical protein J5821_04855, partial [Alphaproteobacteria bacterium]|nr:hypothetical protein [Alphaproteobacteria bacterium]
MKWFAKKVFDRGRVRLKKQEKSIYYLYKIFSFVKFYIRKILAEKKGIRSDRCTQNTGSGVTLINGKLT